MATSDGSPRSWWRVVAILMAAAICIPWAAGPGLWDLGAPQWFEVAVGNIGLLVYLFGLLQRDGVLRLWGLRVLAFAWLMATWRVVIESLTHARAVLEGDWATVLAITCWGAAAAGFFLLMARKEEAGGV